MSEALLPVHGFVLAGGKSSRMGQDKALLQLRGVPMIEIAVARLRTFCSWVSIVGNRSDLSALAPIVPEARIESGPGAGIEAGLAVSQEANALFIPVDVPFLPAEVLRRFAEVALEMSAGGGLREFHLLTDREHPTICILQRELRSSITTQLDSGERKLVRLFDHATGGFNWGVDFYEMYGDQYPAEDQIDRWFSNLNTPQELAEAEAWARAEGWQPPTLNGMPY